MKTLLLAMTLTAGVELGTRYLPLTGGDINGNVSVSGSAVFFDLKLAPQTLDTCDTAHEWYLEADITSGGTTGHRNRQCLCTSNGNPSPTYAWHNITSSHLGDTTTCPD